MVDERDLKIISMLRENSQASLSKMAGALGISETAVKKRIDKLKRNGIIRKYTIEVNEFLIGWGKASVGVNIDKGRYLSTIEQIKRIQFVDSIYSCTGTHDIYLSVTCPKGLLEGVHRQIRIVPGVKEVCFNILQDKIR